MHRSSADQTYEMRSAELGGERFSFELRRGDRTRARLIVAPDGRIELRVPKDTSDGWIENFIRRRARWIIRQGLYFEQFRPREPQRRYVSGETSAISAGSTSFELLDRIGSTCDSTANGWKSRSHRLADASRFNVLYSRGIPVAPPRSSPVERSGASRLFVRMAAAPHKSWSDE